MLEKYFNVLLVDDEPDVLSVSKLALKWMTLYDLPIRTHAVESKKEAIEFLTTHPEGGHLALAIIDVVMETDHAGLELCEYIRGDLKNNHLPLIIRTGQAGKAPEKEVIDRYEISGYINKVEATEGRLYSLIKAGVRQYGMTAYSYFASRLLYYVISNMRSAARFRQAVGTGLRALSRSASDRPVESLHESHCFVSTTFFAGSGAYEDEGRGRALSDQLGAMEGDSLSPQGDKIVVTDDHMLLHVEPTADFPSPFQSIWSIGAKPQPFAVKALYMTTRQLQILSSMMIR